jgi:hypothetical protein
MVLEVWQTCGLNSTRNNAWNSMKKGIYVSTTTEIEHSMPQCSILGPILF